MDARNMTYLEAIRLVVRKTLPVPTKPGQRFSLRGWVGQKGFEGYVDSGTFIDAMGTVYTCWTNSNFSMTDPLVGLHFIIPQPEAEKLIRENS